MRTPFNAHWLETGACVPVDIKTTAELLEEIRRLHHDAFLDQGKKCMNNAKLTEEQIWNCNKNGEVVDAVHICLDHQNVVDFARSIEREIGFAKAELWIKRINDAVEAEREACAELVWPKFKVWSEKEQLAMNLAFVKAQEKHGRSETLMSVGAAVLKMKAKAIRARGTSMINEKYEEGLRKADDWANVLRAVYHSAYDECSREYLRKPPQRQWVGLTDEELQFYRKKYSKLFNAGYDKMTDTNLIAETFDSAGFYKEVEAVLKERNT